MTEHVHPVVMATAEQLNYALPSAALQSPPSHVHSSPPMSEIAVETDRAGTVTAGSTSAIRSSS